MFIADAHCDTILRIHENNQTLQESTCQMQLNTMPNLQFFACFVENHEGFAKACELIDKFNIECANNNLNKIRSKYDLDRSKKNAVLCVENGKALDGNIENLYIMYQMGVRLITIMWNGENELGNANGLTDFGKEVITQMVKLNIQIDLSHASEYVFLEVCNLTNKAFLATHSNAKAICNHRRNLSDEQIKEIIKREGFIGLNFYPKFLGNNADIYSIIRHAEHILNLGGENIIGFGSDFDGISDLPIGVVGSESYEVIINEFAKYFGENIARKIAGENLFNFVRNNL